MMVIVCTALQLYIVQYLLAYNEYGFVIIAVFIYHKFYHNGWYLCMHRISDLATSSLVYLSKSQTVDD